MKIVIAGGTGFIGKKLVKRLLDDGCSVVILSRKLKPGEAESDGKIQYAQWDASTVGDWAFHLQNAEAVINLTGEPIAGKRWTDKQKKKIVQSRIAPTRALVAAIEQSSPRPGLLLNASAVGYYGDVEKGEVDETYPPGTGFLADTCALWENEAMAAAGLGVRIVLIRIGVVLSTGGGALPKLLLPFKLWLGGHLGTGAQWMPWIHQDDLVSAIVFILNNPDLYGPFNCVSPAAVTMREFAKILGSVIGRPSWMPVPSFALRLLLGEMSEMLLTGQKAVPKKLLGNGFQFKFNRLDEAFVDLLKR